jgi:hypothetical protein
MLSTIFGGICLLAGGLAVAMAGWWSSAQARRGAELRLQATLHRAEAEQRMAAAAMAAPAERDDLVRRLRARGDL